jgi:copper chaperone CopZ
MCVRTIRTAVRALDVAKEVRVSLDDKRVYVRVADGATADESTRSAVETAIAKAGYTTDHMKADPAAYEKLDSCCKVGGMEKKG